MDKEFLRMQQLAGITNINSDYDPICEIFVEYLTELHLLKNYYSKGILKENISVNEINLLEDTFREKIKNWFTKNAIKPTEAYILTLINKFEKSAKKLGIVDWKDSLFKFSNTDYTEKNSDKFFPDIEDGSPVTKSDKVNKTALAFLGIFITKLVIATSLSLSTLIPQAQEVPPSFTDTASIENVSDKNQEAIKNIEQKAKESIKANFSQDDPLKNPIKTPIITSDSLDVVDVEFPTGEFELDADLEKELVNKLVDNVKKTISSNKNIDSLTIEYGGSIDDIGSDTGDEDNPDGPDKDGLKDLRTGVGKNIADKAIKILKSFFKNVKFNAVKFDNKDNKAGIGFDLNTSEKDPTPKSPSFIPPDARKQKPQPLPKPPSPVTDKPLDKTPETTSSETPPISTDLGRDVTNIANLNRNNQIAFVLAKTNNKLNLYRQLGVKNIINIPDGEFNNIATKGEYNGKKVTPQAQLLAQNVIRSRKNPNAFINAYAKITGTNLGGSRRKASITTGAKGQSSSAPIKEEASIDKILADNSLQTTFKQKAFLAKLINVIYYGEEGKDVLDIESSTDDRFKKEYKEIPSPLGSQEKGERYVYFDKLQNKNPDKYDTKVTKNIVSKIPQLSILLNKINTKAELADFILALFLHTNEQGSSLFSDKKIFATNTGKVRSALFGLNNRIPKSLQEILFGEAEETTEEPDKKLFDVKRFYDILDTKSILLAKLKNINNLEEFYQLCLRVIFPRLPDTFKTETGVSQLKQAIALAANSSTKYKSILDAKPKSVNEEFYRMQQLAGLIKENTASDIDAFFDKDLWSGAAKQGVILKLIQYLIQEREREALNFSGNNTKLVDELKIYLAQIPKDKLEILKTKKGEEIQNLFKKSIEPLINYLGNSGALK